VYLDDAQLWLKLNLEKKLSNKLGVQLILKGRGTNNITQFGRGAVDIGLVYKVHKNIRLMGDYVFIQRKRNSDLYRTQHQYYVALILKKELGKWQFKYRNRFQCRYKSPNTSDDGYIPYYYDRNKVTIKHETTKRFSFYLAEEVNLPFNNPQVKGISRLRSFAGTLIKITKKQQLELYFMCHLQLQNGDWYDQDDSYYPDPLKRNFVYGIEYTIEF
jgi:hypothetical protein